MNIIEKLIRPNIRSLAPYSSARSEFSGKALLSLDANENPFDTDFNRYPEASHAELRKKISEIKNIAPEYIFTGNGSDEVIDIIMRTFCEPAVDNIVSITPSYGMYKVAAGVNNVEFREVELSDDSFDINSEAILKATDERTKAIILCSPNNPTGNLLDRKEIYRLLESFGGITVVDEAYIDFANTTSFVSEIQSFPRLIVLQTLSKAWGAAGLRVGMGFANPHIISTFDRIRYPYNLGCTAQSLAIKQLEAEDILNEQTATVVSERKLLAANLLRLDCVIGVYPSDANFLLVKFRDANAVYAHLANRKIIVRNRSSIALCNNCLRITVGRPEDNRLLLEALETF